MIRSNRKRYRAVILIVILALMLSSCGPHRDEKPAIPLDGLSVAQFPDNSHDTVILNGREYGHYMTVPKMYLTVGETMAYATRKVEGHTAYRYFSGLFGGYDALACYTSLKDAALVSVFIAKDLEKIPDWAEQLSTYQDIDEFKTGIGTSGFSVKYLQVENGPVTEYPGSLLIESTAELGDFIDRHDPEVLSEWTGDGSLMDVLSSYDEMWFNTHQLLIVFLEEPSGSIRHNVRYIFKDPPPKCMVLIDRSIPEVMNDEAAHWYILIELKRSSLSIQPIYNIDLSKDYEIQVRVYTVPSK